MAQKFRDLVAATMSPKARQQAHEIAQLHLAEMELVDLREALKISQNDLAKRLKVTQAAVSRLERRPNMQLETLSNYINALGGELEVRAVLPNRTIKLSHLVSRPTRKKPVRLRSAQAKKREKREVPVKRTEAAAM